MNHSSVHLLGEGWQPVTGNPAADRATVRLSYAPGAADELSQVLAELSGLKARVTDLETDVAALLLTVRRPRPWWGRLWGK